ncbi:beta-casein-like [Molossus molossus]|uniref:beta-casein-like n=1 Tax=Molossus molossus TaxID=27622 RepID=UPI001747991E|nr:beta-casein-like [Molossus molossus]
MKVLILACLVALAFAWEAVESISSSEPRPEKFEHEKQQGREDERQAQIQPIVQPQPLFYPYAEPIPYPVLPQNALPLAQPAMVLPVLQPEVMGVPSTKETIFPKHKVMPLLKSPVVPIMQRQIPNLTDLRNAQLPLPVLQALMSQVPQTLVQTPMLPTQSLFSLSEPQALPISQQVLTYPQGDITIQEPLLDYTWPFYPMTQPDAPVYTVQQSLLIHYTYAFHPQKYPASAVKFYDSPPPDKKGSNVKSDSQLCNIAAKSNFGSYWIFGASISTSI